MTVPPLSSKAGPDSAASSDPISTAACRYLAADSACCAAAFSNFPPELAFDDAAVAADMRDEAFRAALPASSQMVAKSVG